MVFMIILTGEHTSERTKMSRQWASTSVCKFVSRSICRYVSLLAANTSRPKSASAPHYFLIPVWIIGAWPLERVSLSDIAPTCWRKNSITIEHQQNFARLPLINRFSTHPVSRHGRICHLWWCSSFYVFFLSPLPIVTY